MSITQFRKAAPLKNVAAFSALLETVIKRDPHLPGLACFYGPSGLGKSKAAIYGANRYEAAYVECGQFTTSKSLMISILKELGVSHPRGTITDLIEEAIRIMAGNIKRPLIVDEAHHIAHRKFVDVLRELHDKSAAPVILIGEETLPKQLEQFERVHNRILTWVAAQPCDAEDFTHLRKSACPDVAIADDLSEAILANTRGNTRRIVVNLAQVAQLAARDGQASIDLEHFGGAGAMVGIEAPTPRRSFR